MRTNLKHIVVFGSGQGTNFEAMVQHQCESSYRVIGLFSDRKCACHLIAKKYHIPLIFHPLTDFMEANGYKSLQNEKLRLAYDASIVDILDKFASEYREPIDLIVLAGYMRIISAPLLKRFENRIINIHPADLTVLDNNGKRKYVGPHAVYEALRQGEARTRSSIIAVTEGIDEGPILGLGPWVPYEGPYPVTPQDAQCHQNKQKALSDIPACLKILKDYQLPCAESLESLARSPLL